MTPQRSSTHAASSEDRSALRGPILIVLSIGILMSAAALYVLTHFALGVAVGSGLATANFAILAKIGRRIASAGRGGPWSALALVKVIVLMAGVWLLLETGRVSGMGLILGYAALPMGFALSTRLNHESPNQPSGHGKNGPLDAAQDVVDANSSSQQ